MVALNEVDKEKGLIGTHYIRSLLMEVDDSGLVTLCYDFFRPAYQNFSNQMSKAWKIHYLIEYCDNHNETEYLLVKLEEKYPELYRKHIPKINEKPLDGNSRFIITFVTSIKSENLELEVRTIVNVLGFLLKISSTLISVLKIWLGSITLLIEMPTETLAKLIVLYQNDDPELADLGILEIDIPPPPSEQPTAESASEEAETADRPSPESETKAPERPSSETEDSAVPPPRVNIIVEQVTPEVSSAEFSSLHDVPRPFVPPETAEPASVVLPIKENYKWFRVTDLLGDKLPSIRKGSWLLVDTRIREQYERNDLILIGNDNNEVQDGIQVEPYIATPAYNRISLRRVLSSGGFTRDQSGRVIFKVPGLPSTNIVLGVVLAIWTSPLQSTSK